MRKLTLLEFPNHIRFPHSYSTSPITSAKSLNSTTVISTRYNISSKHFIAEDSIFMRASSVAAATIVRSPSNARITIASQVTRDTVGSDLEP